MIVAIWTFDASETASVALEIVSVVSDCWIVRHRTRYATRAQRARTSRPEDLSRIWLFEPGVRAGFDLGNLDRQETENYCKHYHEGGRCQKPDKPTDQEVHATSPLLRGVHSSRPVPQ